MPRAKCGGRHTWKDTRVLTGTSTVIEEQTCEECGLKRRLVDGLRFPWRKFRSMKDGKA